MRSDAQMVPIFTRVWGSWKLSLERRSFDPSELARHYDTRAPHWQQTVDRLGFDAAYETLLARVFRQARYQRPLTKPTILDAGIGTGAMSAALCKTLGQPVEIHGIDISPDMLVQARHRLELLNADLALRTGDLTRLPYASNSFDIVLVAHVLEHLPNPQGAIRELYRVLKPGGVIVTCITRRSPFGAFVQMLWRTHQVDRQTGLAWLRHAGFASVRAIPLCKHSLCRRFSIGYAARKPMA